MAELIRTVVYSRNEEADNIISVVLRAHDGGDLPAFNAGDHVEVNLAPGIARQYSLCNSPSDRSSYKLGVLLASDSRGGSKLVHANMHVGAEVLISPPRSNFSLVAGSRRSILLAGGIGITPLLSMSHCLSEKGSPFLLHYFARSQERCAFLDHIRESDFASCLKLHLDSDPNSLAFDKKGDLVWETGSDAYICGPSGFIEVMSKYLSDAGWPKPSVHVELFSANIDSSGSAFTVFAKRSGKTVLVSEDTTILRALGEAGISADCSCEQGVCGTCLTKVIDGIPDHKDLYQTDNEKQANDQIAICCSRSLSPLIVLDI